MKINILGYQIEILSKEEVEAQRISAYDYAVPAKSKGKCSNCSRDVSHFYKDKGLCSTCGDRDLGLE